MTDHTDVIHGACVYINGDSTPFFTPLTPEQIIHKLYEIRILNEQHGPDSVMFVRFPVRNGQTYVRPAAISAIGPASFHPDNLDDDPED